MKKSEMFDLLAEKVCEVCQVKLDNILNGCKLQSVVDARMLLVQYARRAGLSSDDIALIVLRKLQKDDTYCPSLEVIKNKAKGIDRMFNLYATRCLQSCMFGLMSVEIRNYFRDTYVDFYQIGMKELPIRNK